MKSGKKRDYKRFLVENSNSRIITLDVVKMFLWIMVINSVVYGIIWNFWLRPHFTDNPMGQLWYTAIPMVIEYFFLLLTYIWYRVGKRNLCNSFPDSDIYIIFGSFLYATEYGIMVYFFRSFAFAPLYFAAALLAFIVYRSPKWAIYTCSISCIEAVLIVTDVFEIDTYRIEDMPLGADVMFSAHLVLLLGGISVVLFSLRKNADNTVLEVTAKEKAKSELLASMSHEIRTPINAILGMNEMIMRASNNEEISNYSANIQSSGKALLSLITDILDYSKIEAGEMTLNENTYGLAELIQDSYNLCIQRAEKKGLSVLLDVDRNLPSKISGDEGKIRQILINLLTNAVKYTENGKVIFRVRSTGGVNEVKLRFDVEDTGIGISKENIQTLFEPFTRFDAKRNATIEGTGLGLAIAKKLAAILNGNLSVESEPEVGSTFTLEIPQKVIVKDPIGDIYEFINRQKKNEYHARFTAPKAQVLAVDDVNVNLLVLGGLLKGTKVNITNADSGAKALELVKNNHYDIILMDHLMPVMDGIETFEKIKALGDECANSDTPVIVLTANAVAGVKEEYLEKGFTDYLSKPLDGTELENLLLKYLPKRLIEKVED